MRHLLQARLGITICKPTFYRWLMNGTLPSVKLVSRYYIKPAALEKFIEEADWQ